jgi:hypothetical protein
MSHVVRHWKGVEVEMTFSRWLVLLVAVAIVGCQPGAESVTPPAEKTGADAVRETLEGVVQTGEGGSALGAMMDAIEQMKADDPETAAALEADATEIMGMSDPAKVKAKAQEMLDKLGSGGTVPEG